MAADKLTPLQETEARRKAAEEAKKNKKTVVRTDEEKAIRKERVEKAKDALARSVGMKGDHVAPARTALKEFLRNLNEPKQPDDSRFATFCLLYTSPSPRDRQKSRMPSSA